MPTRTTEYQRVINRAVWRAYGVLVKRHFYHFEFRVTISPGDSAKLDQPHTVRIETTDAEVSVQEQSVPFEHIEKCSESGAHDFDTLVDALLTELVIKMGAAGHHSART